jgi:hypothetical protein
MSEMLRVLIIDIRYEGISGGFKTSDLSVEGLRLIRDAILFISLRVV